MIQIGQYVHRFIATLMDNYNEEASFIFAKLDTKDVFWRLEVRCTDVWNFWSFLPQFHYIKKI